MSDQIEKWFAGGMLAFVQALIAAGANPNSALRLAAFVVIESQFGREVTEGTLNLPRSTAARWRAEVGRLDGQAVPDDVPVDVLNQLMPLMGLGDLRVHRAGDDA